MHDICDFLALSDLFVVGIALDLVGAMLLAWGLLRSPRSLLVGGLDGINGLYDPRQVADLSRDRVDARTGVLALGCGFLLQAVGYLVELGKQVNDATGSREVIGALVLAVLAGVVVSAVHFVLRTRMTKRTVVRVARALDPELGDPGTILLVQVGRAAGWLNADDGGLLVGGFDGTYDMRLPVIEEIYGLDLQPRETLPSTTT